MFEHLDDPTPPRSDELRERVLVMIIRRRRARRLATAGTGAMLCAALVVLGLNRSSGGRSINVASHATTSTSSGPSPGDVESSAGALPGVTTTSSLGNAPTQTRMRPSPPTSDQRPTGTVPMPTTTSPAPVEACRAADLAVMTTTDHGAYAYGGTVSITVTVQNRGNRACIRPEPPYNADTVTITDSNGNAVWDPPRRPPGIGVYHPPTTLPPGSSYTYSTTAWDQHSCDSQCSGPSTAQPGQEGNQVPPGSYIAQGHVVTADGQTLSAPSSSFVVGPP